MKGNNYSKIVNGQKQSKGKVGKKQVLNSNPNHYARPMQNQQKKNNNNNYQQYNNKNKIGNRQARSNYYENSKNQNRNNNNNVLLRNAKMILNNNMNNNINNRQKAKSAKKLKENVSKTYNNRYQNVQENYNYGMNNMMYRNNNRQNKPQNYNNNYNYNYNNQYNINKNPKINNKARTPKMNQVLSKSSNYDYIEFTPYTLKDYKELTRNPVVMGPVGANIGTKEWEMKRNKMKKMQSYSNNINKEHKGIISLKKDTPQDEIEKITKQKIENSNRYKAFEYGKLVRAGKYKDEGNIEKNLYDNYGVMSDNENDLYLRKYEDQLRQETENMYNPKPKEPVAPVVEEKNEPKDSLDIDQLLKQKEAYKAKINDIRNTLLD